MSRILSMGPSLSKCIINFCNSAARRSFSIAISRGSTVEKSISGKPEPSWARPEPSWARRIRDADHLKYHPVINEIKNEDELRAKPRCSVDIPDPAYELFHQLKSMPQYQPFFVSLTVGEEQVAEDIEVALDGRNMYEAGDYLSRANFANTLKSFQRSIYADLWTRSATVTPKDLTQVLRLISTWIGIGVIPANLFSEAFRLLPENVSRETVILCAFYKGFGGRMALPRDDVIFPVLEDYLLAEGSTLAMLELKIICGGFLRSLTLFSSRQRSQQLHRVVMNRFLELLRSNPWNSNARVILRFLTFTRRYEPSQLKMLQPALETSGFFEFCLEDPSKGIRDLQNLADLLASLKFKDGPLLAKCLDTLEILLGKENNQNAMPIAIANLYRDFSHLGIELDDDHIDFAMSYFRQLITRDLVYGQSIYIFLQALAVNGVFPHDLIDAFFSSKEFMLVEDGKLPGMTNDGRRFDPWIPLLRFDTCIELMCPDYAGARLPLEVRKLALDELRLLEEDRKYIPENHLLANALNQVFNESGRTQKENIIAIARPEPTFLRDFIVVELDENDEPISLANLASRSRNGKSRSRKIAITTLVKPLFLATYDGVNVTEMAEIKPYVRWQLRMVERRGYEVATVRMKESDKLASKESFKFFAKNLISKICKTKSLK